MRIRDAYPRGEKWLRGENEEWENSYEARGYLHTDPRYPDLYDMV